MEWWHWVLIGAGAMAGFALLVVMVSSGTVMSWVSRPQRLADVPPLPYAAGRARPQGLEALYNQARRILDHFAGLPGAGALGVEVPEPETVIDQNQVEEFDAAARDMAGTERTAHLQSRTSAVLMRVAESIMRSQGRIQGAHERTAENLIQAYHALGLQAPPMRTEQELEAADRHLQRAMERLATLTQ